MKKNKNQHVERTKEGPVQAGTPLLTATDNHDYFAEEAALVRQFFNIEELLEFQEHYEIQVGRLADWQFTLYINRNAYGTFFTPLGALVLGMRLYKNYKDEIRSN